MTGSCASVGGIFEDLSGMEIEGYEIHMGGTVRAVPPLSYVMEQNGSHLAKMDGCQRNHVYAVRIHGFFDREGIAETVVSALLKKGTGRSSKRRVSIRRLPGTAVRPSRGSHQREL